MPEGHALQGWLECQVMRHYRCDGEKIDPGAARMCTTRPGRGTRRDVVRLVIGFAIGYYLGSKAGRERYEQIRRRIDDARRSGPVQKAQAAVEPMVERVRQRTEALTDTANGPGASS